ncbi:MAG TPA: hypothetical protein PKD15_02990 [Candidatus Saccharibacteria bacterium]|jgi:hypothetical protein|nr:hypothetical protein [Candidatus Saccharibacteria bacterium]
MHLVPSPESQNLRDDEARQHEEIEALLSFLEHQNCEDFSAGEDISFHDGTAVLSVAEAQDIVEQIFLLTLDENGKTPTGITPYTPLHSEIDLQRKRLRMERPAKLHGTWLKRMGINPLEQILPGLTESREADKYGQTITIATELQPLLEEVYELSARMWARYYLFGPEDPNDDDLPMISRYLIKKRLVQENLR